MYPLAVLQSAEVSHIPVFLSVAGVPAGRDERKSKDPENVSPHHMASGSSLKNIFSEACAALPRFHSKPHDEVGAPFFAESALRFLALGAKGGPRAGAF
jgi:hypothetical protein